MFDEFPVKREPVDWAFRHLINYPEVSCILSGMTTLEQLKQNIEIFSAPDAVPGCFSNEEKELMKQVKKAYDGLVSIPCTGCEYCLPCPKGVNIPGVFSRYNDGMAFQNFDQPKRELHVPRAQRPGCDQLCCAAAPVRKNVRSTLTLSTSSKWRTKPSKAGLNKLPFNSRVQMHPAVFLQRGTAILRIICYDTA